MIFLTSLVGRVIAGVKDHKLYYYIYLNCFIVYVDRQTDYIMFFFGKCKNAECFL